MITTSTEPYIRGLDYLYRLRSLVLEPEMIDIFQDRNNRILLCTWIGEYIDTVNANLANLLQACHACFHAWEQPQIQIFAAPLAQSFGIDGLCNLYTNPITILVDVGRVEPEDWLRLVVHEYAHAHAGSPGHHEPFLRSLTHLCLGLGIAPPLSQSDLEDSLRFYPNCLPTQDPLAFWQGEGLAINPATA